MGAFCPWGVTVWALVSSGFAPPLVTICLRPGSNPVLRAIQGVCPHFFEHPIAEGDTIKVVLEIDPSKTDYDQTPVEVVKTV